MEQETLFTAAKWDILEALSKKNMSPLELSAYVNTSMANISQSLRMLELAGIVKSKRVPNRDKGQPRIVYSIQKDIALPIIVAKGSTHKTLMEINNHRKAILTAWYYSNKKHQAIIEKFLWEIEPHFKDITRLDVENTTDSTIEFSIEPEDVANKIKVTKLTAANKTYNIKISSKPSGEGYSLQAPIMIIGGGYVK